MRLMCDENLKSLKAFYKQMESARWRCPRLQRRNSHESFSELMCAWSLSAGPSLRFMALTRWSSVRSSRACPSISCERNSLATSFPPAEKEDAKRPTSKSKVRLLFRTFNWCIAGDYSASLNAAWSDVTNLLDLVLKQLWDYLPYPQDVFEITWKRVDVRIHLLHVPMRWTCVFFCFVRNADCFCCRPLLLSLLLCRLL